MTDLIKAVYDVFGDKLPTRSDYSSEDRKPFPVLTITTKFNTWAQFESAYIAYVILQRNKKTFAKVVTKPVRGDSYVRKG